VAHSNHDTGWSRSAAPTPEAVFYRTDASSEPVREWLLSLSRADRKTIGQDVKTAQHGWPLGMPLIREVAPRLWEVGSHISDGVARVVFTVDGSAMVLLHGVVKKSRKMPAAELRTSRRCLARLDEE
jgi:phage-related protein